MNKEQRKKLKHKFPVFLTFFDSRDKASMVVGNINNWLYENSYEETAQSVHSFYGYHILISDSEFYNKTI